MAILFDVDHNGGSLAEYTSTVEDSGDLSAQVAAALAGTSYGMQLVIDDTTAIYGECNLATPNTSGTVRWRFYIDPNTLTMTNGNAFIIAYPVSGTPAGIAAVELTYTTVAGYQIRARIINDAGSFQDMSYYVITDEPHYIEVCLIRATTDVASDGSIQLWIDGVSKETLSGVDNYDKFASFDFIRIGAVSGIDAGTSGTFFLDELVVNDDGSEIGAVSTGDASVTGVAATASAAGVAPALTGVGAVIGVVGTSAAGGVAPSLSGGGTVTGAAATADAAGVAPALSGNASVTSTVSTASADAIAPAISVSASVTGVVADAPAAGIGPSLSGVGSVISVVADAPAAMIAPTVTGSSGVQKKYPVSDTYVGNWTTNTGATTNLFDALNETSYSDTDYIKSEESPSSSPCVVKLDNLADPESSTGHILRYRYGKEGQQNINIAVQLRQGYTNEGSPGTLIAEWSHTNVSALTTATQTLSGAEADSITDYSSLFVRMVGSIA